LFEGLSSILVHIYNPKNYFARVRNYLETYPPNPRRQPLVMSDCVALGRSIVRQGIFSRHALSYWRLFFDACTRDRQSFLAAIRLAILGYHLEKVTRINLEGVAKPSVGTGVQSPVAAQA
jgi:hypothetical protein